MSNFSQSWTSWRLIGHRDKVLEAATPKAVEAGGVSERIEIQNFQAIGYSCRREHGLPSGQIGGAFQGDRFIDWNNQTEAYASVLKNSRRGQTQ